MAALADGDRASAATALQDAATLAVANIATTVLERRVAILTPMGRGFVPLAKAPQRCEPGTPLFDTERLMPAVAAVFKAERVQQYLKNRLGHNDGKDESWRVFGEWMGDSLAEVLADPDDDDDNNRGAAQAHRRCVAGRLRGQGRRPAPLLRRSSSLRSSGARKRDQLKKKPPSVDLRDFSKKTRI